MKEKGISQVPVLDEGHLAGIVTESGLLDIIIREGQRALDMPVGGALSDAYELVDPDAPVGPFQRLFSQGKVLVVWERGEVRGIVTKIDVIDFLAQRQREA